jgi:hypothetical protein
VEDPRAGCFFPARRELDPPEVIPLTDGGFFSFHARRDAMPPPRPDRTLRRRAPLLPRAGR